MIDVIEESRMELRGDFLHIAEETKSLRAESRMLGELQIKINIRSLKAQPKDIRKTCPCNIQRFFSVAKIENFIRKLLICFLFLLKT